jgi:hypothetical protein
MEYVHDFKELPGAVVAGPAEENVPVLRASLWPVGMVAAALVVAGAVAMLRRQRRRAKPAPPLPASIGRRLRLPDPSAN